MGRKIAGILLLFVVFCCNLLAAPNSQQEILKEIESLKAEIARLEREQEALFSQIRFQIRGWTKGTLTRNVLAGQGEAVDFQGRLLPTGVVGQQFTNLRLRIGVGSNVVLLSDLKAALNWASRVTQLSADNFVVRAYDKNMEFTGGTYWASFTPLTLYYAVDDPVFEAPIFKLEREEERTDLGIEPYRRKIEGIVGKYTVNDLGLEGLLARVVSKDRASFHRYLWGLRSQLRPREDLAVGVNYVALKDDPASGNGAPLSSELLGAAGELKLNKLTVKGEWVRSLYDENVAGGLPAVRDYAFTASLEYQFRNFQAVASYYNNGPSYYAPTAQSRDYELADPGATWFGLPELLTAGGGKVAFSVDEAQPFGPATPNRRGFQLRLSSGDAYFEHTDLTEGKPMDENWLLAPQITTRRRYIESKAGGKIKLDRIMKIPALSVYTSKVELYGNYVNRITQRQGSAEEEFKLSQRCVDLGLGYQLQPGWILFVGNKRKMAVEERSAAKVDSYANYLRAGVQARLSPQTILLLGCQMAEADKEDFKADTIFISLKAGF